MPNHQTPPDPAAAVTFEDFGSIITGDEPHYGDHVPVTQDVVRCAACAALVAASDKADHRRWHRSLRQAATQQAVADTDRLRTVLHDVISIADHHRKPSGKACQQIVAHVAKALRVEPPTSGTGQPDDNDAWEPEWLYCADCEADGCDCGGGFYEVAPDEEPHCPCCGSHDVNP